jgi:hypothetical protein
LQNRSWNMLDHMKIKQHQYLRKGGKHYNQGKYKYIINSGSSRSSKPLVFYTDILVISMD